MRYLIDTNVLSALVRDPRGVVLKRIRQVGEANVLTSIIVAAELRYGAAKKGSPRLLAQLEAVLEVLEVAPLDAPADAIYGDIRAQLEKSRRPEDVARPLKLGRIPEAEAIAAIVQGQDPDDGADA